MSAAAAPVPLPSQVEESKYYLPACDLVATVASQAQAEALEQGLLALLQYRGNPVGGFNAATGLPESSGDLFDFAHHCPIAAATRLQLFASVALGDPASDPDALMAASAAAQLEPWESAYVAAAAAFLRHDLEGCVALCRANMQQTPRDVFSARLLLIAAYFGEDLESICDVFGAITAEYEAAIAAQAGCSTVKHALHLALPSLMAWAAFGLEETRRDVARAEELARAAIALTQQLNDAYFPSGSPGTDMPERAGAMASVSNTNGFLCVFGVHAVCHCFETRGDPRGGLAFLKAVDGALWKPSEHLAGHVWWHYALFELEGGDVAGSLQTFGQRLGDPVVGDPFALSDSAALVLRVWQWSSWFKAASTTGIAAEAAPWGVLSPDDERATVAAIQMLDERWKVHGADKLADFPFFMAHKQLVHAAASTVVSDDRFASWPTGVPCPKLHAPRDVALVTDGAARRHSLNDHLCAGATALQAAASAAPGPARLSAVSDSLSAWLGAVAALAPAKPCSASTRVVKAAAPMGGSVAQQSLLSLPLLLLWLLSDDRAAALLALRALALQQPKNPLIQAILVTTAANYSGKL